MLPGMGQARSVRRGSPTGWEPLDRLTLHSAGTMSYPPGATFGPRLLTDFELVWIISGDSRAYQDGRVLPAPAGTVLLQRPGTRDAYDWATDSTTLHAFIHFGCRREGRGWPPIVRWPVQRSPSPDSLILTLFRFILGLHDATATQAAPVLLPALELLLRAFVAGQGEAPSAFDEPLPEAVTRVFKLVRDKLGQDPGRRFRLADLARAAHVSPQHLCRVFGRTLDRGPMECVRHLRIERAATLLERTGDPVRAVADRCGFASPYHFSRVFREIYGVAPGAYRQRFLLGIKRGIARPRRPAVFGDAALQWLRYVCSSTSAR